jgi:glycosyltransferase involved in cell wall biosynthesis
MKISAVVLTKNEEKNIERCLKSLGFCDEVIIVDDYSIDNTRDQISKIKDQNDILNIKIFEKHLNNDFATQRNFGLSKATNEWVLFIDADEEVSEELKTEIVLLFHGSIIKENAFYLKRRDYFWNEELKFGEVKKIRNLGLVRLVKKSSGKWMGNVHEVFHTAKNAGQLNNFINHYPHPSLKEFINDINSYSDIRAEELNNQDVKTNVLQIIFFPFLKFIYNYFFNLGFLDGPAGFTYAFMMSFHSFLVRAKLYQLTNKR